MKKKIQKPTIAGLALQTEIDRKTIRRRLIENGNYPPGKHSQAACLKAIRPPGSGSTLENAKARLLDAKVRAIERTEKLTGGDVLPVAWFAECVNQTFRDNFSFGSFEQLHAETLEDLIASGKVYGETKPGVLMVPSIRPEHQKAITQYVGRLFKSLRSDVEATRDRLLSHLREGTPESGGRTTLADVDDYIQEIAKRLSETAKAELRAALASMNGSLAKPQTKKNL